MRVKEPRGSAPSVLSNEQTVVGVPPVTGMLKIVPALLTPPYPRHPIKRRAAKSQIAVGRGVCWAPTEGVQCRENAATRRDAKGCAAVVAIAGHTIKS